MRHSEIIAALGGIDALARRVRRHRTRVGAWRRTGIPSAVWPEIIEFASELGIRGITPAALLAGQAEKGPVPPLPRGRRPRRAAPWPDVGAPLVHGEQPTAGTAPSPAGQQRPTGAA